jgi:hypothetical protein
MESDIPRIENTSHNIRIGHEFAETAHVIRACERVRVCSIQNTVFLKRLAESLRVRRFCLRHNEIEKLSREVHRAANIWYSAPSLGPARSLWRTSKLGREQEQESRDPIDCAVARAWSASEE